MYITEHQYSTKSAKENQATPSIIHNLNPVSVVQPEKITMEA